MLSNNRALARYNFRLFRIIKVIKDYKLAYKLDLLKQFRMHNIFLVLSLKPYYSKEKPKAKQRKGLEIKSEDYYKIKKILDYKRKGKSKRYLIY